MAVVEELLEWWTEIMGPAAPLRQRPANRVVMARVAV